MKKTLLALAVMTAAGAVSAAEIANTGNLAVTAAADFEVKLQQGAFAENLALSYDNAEIDFAATTDVNDNVSAFLNYGLEMSYDGDAVTSKDIVAGFVFNEMHTVEFGETSHVLDLGNSQHKDLGADIGNDDLPSVTDIIVYKYAGESFGAGASLELAGIEGEETSGYAVYLDGSVGDVTLRGDLGMGADDDTDTSATIYGVKATYAADVFSIGGAYSASSLEVASVTTDTSIIDAWVGFSAGLDWYLGTQMASQEDDSAMTVYLNTNYTLNEVVGLYAEVGMADKEISGVTEDGFGFSLGMTMTF